MQPLYPKKILFENYPSTNTPLGESTLNIIDNAVYGLDQRVLNLYGYESRVAESEKNAKSSEINAKTSEENAKESELLAKQYADRLFDATPEGYNEVVDTVEANREAIESINSDLNNKIQITDMPNAICEFRFPTNEAKTEYYALNVNASSMSYSFEGVNHRLPYWNFEPLKNYMTTDDYARVLNSDGAAVGNDLKTHQSPKPIYVVDPQNPSYYWYGIFYHNGQTDLLNEISSNGLTVDTNAYGTISPSGGSGSYTFINMIPTGILW